MFLYISSFGVSSLAVAGCGAQLPSVHCAIQICGIQTFVLNILDSCLSAKTWAVGSRISNQYMLKPRKHLSIWSVNHDCTNKNIFIFFTKRDQRFKKAKLEWWSFTLVVVYLIVFNIFAKCIIPYRSYFLCFAKYIIFLISYIYMYIYICIYTHVCIHVYL